MIGVIFGVIVPYIAVAIFVAGVVYRFVNWANSAVPLKIPTTGGQQKSFPFIKRTIYDRFDSPYTWWETVGRMILEIFMFRSLLKNTRYYLDRASQKDARWLWLFAILFHYSLLLVLIRHSRFFLQPVPEFVEMLSEIEAFKGVFIPSVYISGLAIVAGLFLLWLRRIFLSRERTLSLPSDHFALILLLAITISGNIMRYFFKADLAAVKELLMNLMVFNVGKAAAIADSIEPIFYIHFALASFLLAYFPFSKLMHAGGVLFTPTRNMPNDNRAKRHINPWDSDPSVPILTKGITVSGMTFTSKKLDWDTYYSMYTDQLDEIAESDYKIVPEEL
ncbi:MULTISPECIES: sulfate reduction electron transfer complex DsrMKJOP subunit DsrM [unclassified Archaeoglobus]|jgi:nitrate reductase gamma subunit|uniref:sulfate reduction electron transfer complex DsrMKJOP subunit DsrM n=1 Tax=unclassified Archaeoglobus TaxID=2643606 RepID=UPI0025C4D7CE|nr:MULTISPECIES: sulfate reduction electron transfer complex DsrMKJOP subunit DsrM [unclassified Archaeoglobus]